VAPEETSGTARRGAAPVLVVIASTAASRATLCGCKIYLASMSPHLHLKREEIATLCRLHHIRRLAFFGSVLRGDFRDQVLREAEPVYVAA
jgi:hypothetical protein